MFYAYRIRLLSGSNILSGSIVLVCHDFIPSSWVLTDESQLALLNGSAALAQGIQALQIGSFSEIAVKAVVSSIVRIAP